MKIIFSHYDVFVKINGKWIFEKKEGKFPGRLTGVKFKPRYRITK